MAIYKLLPIESLQSGHYQPRKNFDDTALKELAQSILTQGLIEPLVVREISHLRYEIIAGERRWRAAMMAKLTEIPCLIGTYSNLQAAAVTLIENIQRQNLNLLEEANGYQRLHLEFHFSQAEIAAIVGKSRSHIANILRLLTLSATVQEKISTGLLSLGHARALVGLAVHQQEMLAIQIHEKDWSVRHLESEVRLMKRSLENVPAPNKNCDTVYLQSQLSEQMGTPIQIIGDTQQGGWLKIQFFDNDTLTGLLDRMGLSYD